MVDRNSESQVFAPFVDSAHDHGGCVDRALSDAEQACHEKGLRLTHVRRKVLELIWRSHKPVKAYDILGQLGPDDGSVAPPTVYRALEFLQAAGLVHRIESQNAFVGCGNPSEKHQGQFLICEQCGSVAEINDESIRQAIAIGANKLGFAVDTHMLEISGRCPECHSAS